MKISVLVPVKDEQDMIGECLESVKWADEVIALDNDSSDETAQIIRSYPWVKYVFEKGGTYASRKNKLQRVAQGEWLFYLDADERVTPLLKEEIKKKIKKKGGPVAYAVPRRNFLLGKELRWGGWGNDYVMRLFKKEHFGGFEGDLHEQAVFEGEFGKLAEPMLHFQPETLEVALEKSIFWSGVEAGLFMAPGVNHPPVTWWRALKMGAATIIGRLVRKQGFRDGVEGWIESVYQAYHTMIVYLRLWEMQRGEVPH